MSPDDTSDRPGFATPPKSSQFTKGRSGNPNGRPKGSRNLKTDLANLMDGKVEITINGDRRKMSRQEAILLSLFQRSILKDGRAAKTLLDMVVKLQLPDDIADVEPELSENDQRIVENFLRRNTSKSREG